VGWVNPLILPAASDVLVCLVGGLADGTLARCNGCIRRLVLAGLALARPDGAVDGLSGLLCPRQPSGAVAVRVHAAPAARRGRCCR
jgi:hypothetical protein